MPIKFRVIPCIRSRDAYLGTLKHAELLAKTYVVKRWQEMWFYGACAFCVVFCLARLQPITTCRCRSQVEYFHTRFNMNKLCEFKEAFFFKILSLYPTSIIDEKKSNADLVTLPLSLQNNGDAENFKLFLSSIINMEWTQFLMYTDFY